MDTIGEFTMWKRTLLILAGVLCITAESPAKQMAPKPPEKPTAASLPAGTKDPKNKIEPITNEQELQDRAKGLFDAIVNDDPSKGEAFWFPKDAFIPVKSTKPKQAEAYWKKLYKAYGEDINTLHKSRKDWKDCTFVRYELGDQKWINPGLEYNAIGYYRTMYSKLVYKTPKGTEKSIPISVSITWQGRWYVVHLTRLKP
jgi:hypothetical protein